MTGFIHDFNNIFYSYCLIIVLLGCGIYFTVRTRAVQLRMLGESFRILSHKKESSGGRKQISNFQSFVLSVAGRVGAGNIAGVALAITIGGPGAVFWMWVIALLGAATGFVESTLAQVYRRKNGDELVGGTAYYIEDGLHCRPLAIASAIMIAVTFSFGFNSIQSNTLGLAFESMFGWDHLVVGIIVTILVGIIIMGGIHSIARVNSAIVPFMSIGYLILAVIVIVMNIDSLPDVFGAIFRSAFGVDQVAGGLVGGTIAQGVRRGLFSNEAGLGSIPQAAAAAKAHHPVQQGLAQAMGVMVDTLLICSCTAFIILFSKVDISGSVTGINLAQNALESQLGPIGSIFITVALFFFVFSSLITLYYYGEANVRFLTRNKWALLAFRLATLAVIMLGFCASLDLVWEFTDTLMGICAIINLIAITALFPKVSELLKDYEQQKKDGKTTPVYDFDAESDKKKIH